MIRYFSDLSFSHLAGTVSALMAATIAALVLFANRWADQAHVHAVEHLPTEQYLIPKKPWLAIYVETHALRIAIPPLVVLTLVLDILGTVSTASPWTMVIAFIIGALIRTPTQICLRTAYSYSSDAALPTIESSLPLVSFVILSAFGEIYVQQWDTLMLGIVATTLGLALLQFEVDGYRRDYFGDNVAPHANNGRGSTLSDDRAMPRARHGFKALIISVYCVGVFVYYRPTEITNRLLFRWTGQEYWGLLALSATGFFLLLAFRITYIRNRIDAEEQKVAQLLRKIELLRRFQILDNGRGGAKELIQDMLALDRVKNPYQTSDALESRSGGPLADIGSENIQATVLSHNYDKARSIFENAWSRINQSISDADASHIVGSAEEDLHADSARIKRADLVELSSILASVEQDFDTLTHSRQHGSSFGDFFSVGVLGIATLLLTLGGLPQSTDAVIFSAIVWESFLLECFIILFCAVLVFLIFSLYDEITERRIPLYAGYSEKNVSTGNRELVRLNEADAYGVWFRAEQEGGIVSRRVVAAFLGLVVYSGLVVLLLGKWSLLGSLILRP
ncbi:hypothetical protein [Candidatus Poriferisodalis sp.]|uniref:hypothetical protein n=1 Tax=Candidatus Poriferisodalis sp. TaxID=3101277 RepID=UPI003B012CD4